MFQDRMLLRADPAIQTLIALLVMACLAAMAVGQEPSQSTMDVAYSQSRFCGEQVRLER